MNTATQSNSSTSRLSTWQPKMGAGTLAATIAMIGALHLGGLQAFEQNAVASAAAYETLGDDHQIVVQAPRLVSKAPAATRTASATPTTAVN